MFKQSTNIVVGLILFTIGNTLHPMNKSIESPNKKFFVSIVDENVGCSLGNRNRGDWVEIALKKKNEKNSLFQKKLSGGNLKYLVKFDKNNKWFYALNKKDIYLVNLITQKTSNLIVESNVNEFEFCPNSEFAYATTTYAQGKRDERNSGGRKKMVRLIDLSKKKYTCLDCSYKAKCTFDPHEKTFQVKDGEKLYSHNLENKLPGFTSDLIS